MPEIDFSKLATVTEDERQALLSIVELCFQQNNHVTLFDAGTEYLAVDEASVHPVSFKQSILKSHSSHDPNAPRYFVIDDQQTLGVGGNGMVFHSLYVLKPSTSGLIFQDRQLEEYPYTYVAKCIYFSKQNQENKTESQLNMEFKYVRDTAKLENDYAYFHSRPHKNYSKPIVVQEDKRRCWLIMPHAKGLGLDKLITSGKMDSASFLRRLSILDQLMSYLERFASRGHSHADLKESNLVYDWESNILRVVDYGSMRNSRDAKTITTVTFGYCAPELILKKVPSHKTDIFSAKAIFLNVFGAHHCINSKKIWDQEFLLNFKFESFVKLIHHFDYDESDLFSTMTLSAALKEEMLSVFKGMGDFTVESRWSATDVKAAVGRILKLHKTETIKAMDASIQTLTRLFAESAGTLSDKDVIPLQSLIALLLANKNYLMTHLEQDSLDLHSYHEVMERLQYKIHDAQMAAKSTRLSEWSGPTFFTLFQQKSILEKTLETAEQELIQPAHP